MGPREHRAIMPKLLVPAFSDLPMEARPRPRAMMKGTVMGPVVTPPESKATARNSWGTKSVSRNTTA